MIDEIIRWLKEFFVRTIIVKQKVAPNDKLQWTEMEIKFLTESKMKNREIAFALNRSTDAVKQKKSRLRNLDREKN